MKNLFTLFLSTALLFSCSEEINREEIELINLQSSISFSNLTLTYGPKDSHICTEDTGFYKNGDIEAIIDSPHDKSLIITYEVWENKKAPGSPQDNYQLVPSFLGGGAVGIYAGDTRGTSIICKNEASLYFNSECNKSSNSLKLLSKQFKLKINSVVDTDGIDYTDDITLNHFNNNNKFTIKIRCPYQGGGLE